MRDSTPKKDRQGEFQDSNGVIKDNTPNKDRQEEFDDKQGVIRDRTPYAEEGYRRRV